jgi:hypothetical protein
MGYCTVRQLKMITQMRGGVEYDQWRCGSPRMRLCTGVPIQKLGVQLFKLHFISNDTSIPIRSTAPCRVDASRMNDRIDLLPTHSDDNLTRSIMRYS